MSALFLFQLQLLKIAPNTDLETSKNSFVSEDIDLCYVPNVNVVYVSSICVNSHLLFMFYTTCLQGIHDCLFSRQMNRKIFFFNV